MCPPNSPPNSHYDIETDETGRYFIRVDPDTGVETTLVLSDAQGNLGVDAYEIIAFLAQANTNPIGTKIVSWFDENMDLRTLGIPNSPLWPCNHSFQFHYDAAVTWDFYAYLKQQLVFQATY